MNHNLNFSRSLMAIPLSPECAGIPEKNNINISDSDGRRRPFRKEYDIVGKNIIGLDVTVNLMVDAIMYRGHEICSGDKVRVITETGEDICDVIALLSNGAITFLATDSDLADNCVRVQRYVGDSNIPVAANPVQWSDGLSMQFSDGSLVEWSN